MNLKIGGNSVGKIMYGGQEFGGATKLEPGTILYISKYKSESFENAHLSSTTKNWSNIDGINVKIYRSDRGELYADINITGDDFKNLNEAKTYEIKSAFMTVTVSRTIVDGEYRLNVSVDNSTYIFEIGAL